MWSDYSGPPWPNSNTRPSCELLKCCCPRRCNTQGIIIILLMLQMVVTYPRRNADPSVGLTTNIYDTFHVAWPLMSTDPGTFGLYHLRHARPPSRSMGHEFGLRDSKNFMCPLINVSAAKKGLNPPHLGLAVYLWFKHAKIMIFWDATRRTWSRPQDVKTWTFKLE